MHLPTLVTGLQGKQVVHVAALGNHTICCTADGSVFTWGASDHGKLGLGEDDYDRLVPTLVRGELQNKAVVQVAAGAYSYHSLCATKDGLVYTMSWGNNDEDQLGVVDNFIAYLPVLVQTLEIDAIE